MFSSLYKMWTRQSKRSTAAAAVDRCCHLVDKSGKGSQRCVGEESDYSEISSCSWTSSPLISCSGRVPGRVHIAWAKCPNTVASNVEILEPMKYFLSPAGQRKKKELTKKCKLNIHIICFYSSWSPVLKSMFSLWNHDNEADGKGSLCVEKCDLSLLFPFRNYRYIHFHFIFTSWWSGCSQQQQTSDSLLEDQNIKREGACW